MNNPYFIKLNYSKYDVLSVFFLYIIKLEHKIRAYGYRSVDINTNQITLDAINYRHIEMKHRLFVIFFNYFDFLSFSRCHFNNNFVIDNLLFPISFYFTNECSVEDKEYYNTVLIDLT